MLLRQIALGAVANDGTGTGLREGGRRINLNFTQLYNAVGHHYAARDYGAVGDGASHTVGTAVGLSGITTLATLAAYVHPVLETTPYAWITSGLWVKNYRTLAISAGAASGATVLNFASTTGITTGMQVRGGAVPTGTTVSAVTGTTVTLSGSGLTSAKAAGMTFTFVTPLADADVMGMEMDSLAIQSAIQAAKVAGGGSVVLGPGNFLCDNTIIIPPRNEATGEQVSLFGLGEFVTALNAKSDFGPGRYLLSCGDPMGHKNHRVGRYAFAYFEGECANFRLEGPVLRYPVASPTGDDIAFGQVPCQMSGIAHGARRTWTRVWSLFFRNGWSLVGDHSLFSQCVGQYCYYGAYIDDSNADLYGDNRFEWCFFTGNSFAAIGVSKNAYLNGIFLKPYFGGQPYHIVGETGISDDYGQPYPATIETPIVQGSYFLNAQCEWAGNGCIVDLGGGADGSGSRARSVVNSRFDGGFFSWDTGKAISGRGQRYYFDFAAAEGLFFSNVGNDSFDLTEGQLACFRVDAVGYYGGGLEMEGALDAVLLKYNGTIPVFAAMERYAEGHWRNVLLRCNGWLGRLGLVNNTAAVLRGTVMEASTDWNGIRPATATARPLVGIVVAGVPASAGGADRMVVVATGENLLARYGSGSIAGGSWVKATSSGTLQPATGPTETQVVGWAWTDGGGGATGTNDRIVRTTFVA